jgi:signal transduction histidine kinase
MKNRASNFIDHISVARKTVILIAVITSGILFFGAFGHLSLYTLKESYNNFYKTKYEFELTLNHFNTLYTIDNIKEDDKIQWVNFKKLDPALSPNDQRAYDKLIKKTDLRINEVFELLKESQYSHELKSSLDSLHQNFTKLSIFQQKYAKYEIEFINKKYNYTIWMMIALTLFLLFFAAVFTNSIIKSTRKLIDSLSEIVKDKINNYENLAETLAYNYEEKVTKEVIKSREKDQIMYHNARLAAMGEMIGNIAHQWRQPLNALTILIQSFGTKSMTGNLTQEFIDKQVDEGLRLADQMSNTIEDFRNFFSPTREREYFSLEKSLKDTLELVEFFCKDEHIDIQIFSKEDLRVFGYSNEFSQVILNLINNARDNFKLKNINNERKIVIKLEKKYKPKPFAMISFIDNGGGIDPKIKDRIFEPYFTTKHKSTGTGIGLYMSKQIVEKQMQGLVTMKNIESKMGGDKVYKCAHFIIAIPIK